MAHHEVCNIEQLEESGPVLFWHMVSTAVRRVTVGVFPAPKKAKPQIPAFDVKLFLGSAGLGRKIAKFVAKEAIFAQGNPATSVMFIQEGGVKLSVVNESGKEAVLAILGPGDFFGEGCLAGQSICMATATAIAPTAVLVIEKDKMMRVLHEQNEFSDRFISYMLERNLRAEEDLIDQLFNSSEKRLARTLLLLARYGARGQPEKLLPKVSQETLAEMIGTTRSRVNFFMNKFRKLGFVQYDRHGQIYIEQSLLSVVLHD
jgi:CRP/FNR family cyclic AMP-dependent transcriptional regulator